MDMSCCSWEKCFCDHWDFASHFLNVLVWFSFFTKRPLFLSCKAVFFLFCFVLYLLTYKMPVMISLSGFCFGCTPCSIITLEWIKGDCIWACLISVSSGKTNHSFCFCVKLTLEGLVVQQDIMPPDLTITVNNNNSNYSTVDVCIWFCLHQEAQIERCSIIFQVHRAIL